MVFFKDGHVSVETSSLFFIPCKPNNNGLEEYYCNKWSYDRGRLLYI